MNANVLFPQAIARPARRLGNVEVEEIVERLLCAPFVDASQVPLHHAVRPESGEMRLALAILDDALRCVLRHTHSALAHQRAEAREARRWIESEETSYALSFVPICQVFNLDPEWIRDMVRRRLAREPRTAWTRPAVHGGSEPEALEREVA
jgi:hypothetical protein